MLPLVHHNASNNPMPQHAFEEGGAGSTSHTPLRELLELFWDIHSTEIRYSLNRLRVFVKQVRRQTLCLLSSRVYDLLGCVRPFVIATKIPLQQIWLCKIRWDKPLPGDLVTVWISWYQVVSLLAQDFSPLYAGTGSSISSKHTRCTEPKYLWGCHLPCDTNDDTHCSASLVLAKARAAAFKAVSLPRHELMGTIVASWQLAFVRHTLPLSDMSI